MMQLTKNYQRIQLQKKTPAVLIRRDYAIPARNWDAYSQHQTLAREWSIRVRVAFHMHKSMRKLLAPAPGHVSRKRNREKGRERDFAMFI